MTPQPRDPRDRHGRAARADNDLRRRPSDGFRTASRARFVALATRAASRLPAELRVHLSGARLRVEEVPTDGDGPGGGPLHVDAIGDVPLCVVALNPPEPATVRLFRRPLELRATSRPQLESELERALRNAVRDALGLGPDGL